MINHSHFFHKYLYKYKTAVLYTRYLSGTNTVSANTALYCIETCRNVDFHNPYEITEIWSLYTVKFEGDNIL